MKAGTPTGEGRYHIQAEINMIPLIDVSLVLLIIFMVISPMIVESQMRVNLPHVTAASQAEQTAFKVEIANDGTYAFQGKIVTKDALRTSLERALPPGHRAALLIQADKDVSFDHVVYVMDIAKQLKVEKLGVSVIPQIAK
jgi:biopolymer transport protein TolR